MTKPLLPLRLFSLVFAALLCSTIETHAAEKVMIGPVKSRGLWTPAKTAGQALAPAVILLPGSGPNGPEEMMPAKLTEDSKPQSLFEQLSEPFIDQGFHVLALGKPGVDWFTHWDKNGWFDVTTLFYDLSLYRSTTWTGLIDNLGEGIKFLKSQPGVDPKRIYILGHSEGTQIASDYAKRDSSIAGYILLGYSGQNIHKILEWQLIKRPIEHFVMTDVDKKHRGSVTRKETAKWSKSLALDDTEFKWPWKKNQSRLTYAEIETYLRESTHLDSILNQAKASALYKEVYDRADFYNETAKISAPLYIYTGSLDLQTPPSEALALKKACDEAKKKDCSVHLIDGLGHGFSPPRGPRRHPLADLTVGPIHPKMVDEMKQLARELSH
jgi:hypothetical protein